MSFFSRSNSKLERGNIGNWGREQLPRWHRGINKRLRFSILFYNDSDEFTQILKIGFLNLTSQGHLPPIVQVMPPIQPHINVVGIHVPPHVSMVPKPQVNDVWNEVVPNQPSSYNGCPNASLHFPPPPPLK